jgi:hypothetical protein
MAAQRAATLIAMYPATPAAITRRLEPMAAPRAMAPYVTYAAKEPTIAILKQFAPMAVIPPSPKKIAWIDNATEMANMEAQGPSTMLATPIPTAWPVVPPGSGRLNIMMTKENAANTDSRGIIRVFNIFFTRLRATIQKGTAAPNRPAQVDGLKYPSGMCMAADHRKDSTISTFVRTIR